MIETTMKRHDLLQGTLDLLVLKTLSAGPMHGYGIAARIHQLSDEVLRVEEGSLYPALYRLEQRRLITSQWKTTVNKKEAKFYSLTSKGRREMQAEAETWARLSNAVGRLLAAVEQGA
jgi:transcriptional regulator